MWCAWGLEMDSCQELGGCSSSLHLPALMLPPHCCLPRGCCCCCVQVALKLEHRSSKGCNYGPPYEWSVYG